jgi:hypothetical protein
MATTMTTTTGVGEWEDFMADYWGVLSSPHASTTTAAREDTDMSPREMEPELEDKSSSRAATTAPVTR